MATIDKLEYINNTKNLIKNALNTKFNSQIGNGDTFRSYAQKIDDIYENWPKVSEENTNFTLNSTKEGKMKIELKGNTSQATSIITYTCLGTESGDYYFVYNSINYQFTMPTVSANDVLAFNTDTLKLYLDTTEITTTTASTGTLITMNTTPNPDYPQDIYVVSGNNTIEVQGKNLFDKNNMHLKSLNAQAKTGNSGTYGSASNQKHIYIKCKSNTTYSIQKNNNINTVLGVFESSEEPAVGVTYKTLYLTTQSSNGKATVTTGENAKYLDIRLNTNSTSAENLQIILDSIQIEYSSTATTYEAYQSQNYPINLGNIELCKIENYQDYITKSTGKNLFDKNNAPTTKLYVDTTNNVLKTSANSYATYMEIQPNTTYTISKQVGEAFRVATTTNIPANNVSILSTIANHTGTSITITTEENANYLYINYFNTGNTGTQQEFLGSIMVEKSNQATSYEPYGKVWYLNKQIGKVVLNGSENWSYTNETFLIGTITDYKLVEENICISSHFISQKNVTSTSGILDKHITFRNQANTRRLYIKDSNITSASDFTTWLASNNVTLYYVLQTPTTTEITDSTLISQLEALSGAKSYNPQTNVSQVNNNLSFILNVSALKKNSSN